MQTFRGRHRRCSSPHRTSLQQVNWFQKASTLQWTSKDWKQEHAERSKWTPRDRSRPEYNRDEHLLIRKTENIISYSFLTVFYKVSTKFVVQIQTYSNKVPDSIEQPELSKRSQLTQMVVGRPMVHRRWMKWKSQKAAELITNFVIQSLRRLSGRENRWCRLNLHEKIKFWTKST